MKLIYLSLIIAVIGFTACSSKTNASRKPVTNILIAPANRTVAQGNSFTISVKSRFTKPQIVEIQLYLNNELIEKSNSDAFEHTLDTRLILPGKHTIKTIAKNSKGLIGTNFTTVSVVSGIRPQQLSYRIIESVEHNTKNYTQGLEFYKGKLYESTGNHGESFIYEYSNNKVKVEKQLKIDNQYFGEGITILNDKIYQLTYKAQKGFVYDVNTFEKINEFTFASKEGWGLTNNGELLIMSDGTSKISYIDPESFKVVKSIEVSFPDGFVNNLNELEYVDGAIYANIWTSEKIVKFDAETGKVMAFINMNGLLTNFNAQRVDVLNGIAYHPDEQLFYVTGKWWPRVFKVVFE